jgi:hypothetical protein
MTPGYLVSEITRYDAAIEYVGKITVGGTKGAYMEIYQHNSFMAILTSVCIIIQEM